MSLSKFVREGHPGQGSQTPATLNISAPRLTYHTQGKQVIVIGATETRARGEQQQ